MGAQLACGVKTTRLSLTYGKEKILLSVYVIYVKGKRICGEVGMFENLEGFKMSIAAGQMNHASM
jgi:hypothetical protein